MKDINPQQLFEEMTAKGHHMFKDFSVNESQEMANEFINSWNTIMTRSMESPEEWLKTITGFYQDQYKLWMNMFNPNAEGVVQPVPGDRRFSAPDWEESPLQSSSVFHSNFNIFFDRCHV